MMGYNYKHTNPGPEQVGSMGKWRSTAEPGMVYRAKQDNTRQRYFEGDLFICLFISGDCHYDWVRISERTNNGIHVYYDVQDRVIGYGKDFEIAFPDMRPFSDHDLVHVLTSKQALISTPNTLTEDQRQKVESLRAKAQSSEDARFALFQEFGITQKGPQRR